MPKQRRIEFIHAFAAVGIARGGHFLQHERMAAHRALAKDDQTARENIRAFDSDRDGHALVAAAQRLVDRGADVICPSGLAFIPVRVSADEVADRIGVPVLDPALIAVRSAECTGCLKSSPTQLVKTEQKPAETPAARDCAPTVVTAPVLVADGRGCAVAAGAGC